jgi:chromosome segregation ATPase
MQEQEEEASNVIAQWQESYSESENKCSELENELEVLRNEKEKYSKALENREKDGEHLEEAKSSLDEKIASLEDAIEDEMRKLEEVQEMEDEVPGEDDTDTLEKLREELTAAQETLQRDEDVVHQWEGTLILRFGGFIVSQQWLTFVFLSKSGRVAELEATVQSLETQMHDQEEEANNVISQWQESCTASDGSCAELEKELAALRKDKESLDIATKADLTPASNEELFAKLGALEAELKEAQETLSRDEDVVSQWEGRSCRISCSRGLSVRT